ncbi:uncharacterized protein LOC129239389 [Anastrepha obliqua]|uniref:uncharacterized protein LOC129239389 n=1 Tax=Anastrepha obliqua TaxID=95512 RepID=UPI0024092BAD|nr:uncharacterized protein LOC129239389 [Anastrepha obliqua]
MWNFSKVMQNLNTAEKCVAFAEENGLVLRSRLCRTHRTHMKLQARGNDSLGTFRCSKGQWKRKSGVSRATGTWFEQCKISLPHIFYLMYAFAHRWSHENVRFENYLEGSCLSTATICDWYNYCREAISLYQIDRQESVDRIGGPGKVVQIDESKFGKRKYNKGRRVEGHWVLGIIEDGSEDLRLEVCRDNICSADVLIPLINGAYDCLANYGYEHKKVNHSDPDNPFVAEDGTHTQRIESQWHVVKRYFNKENYNHPVCFADVIVEYLWRKSVNKNHEDPFVKLIEAIKYSYKP